MSQSFDVIVVGVGTMGAATCWHLARRGVRVLGLERFNVPHGMGAHHGHSRMFRLAYFEHPDYVPLLKRSLAMWEELNEVSALRPFVKTGGLYAGLPTSETVSCSLAAARSHGLDHRSLSHADVRREFPQFELPETFEAMYEPHAGYIVPEHAVALMSTEAVRSGAMIRARERTVGWSATSGGVHVTTERAEYHGAHVVFCCGAWTSSVVAGLGVGLRVTRQILGWVWPRDPDAFARGQFPCWAIEDESRSIFYGFPMAESNPGLKIARHVPGLTVNPETLDRSGATADDEESFREGLRRFLPSGDGPTMSIATCMYTMSPDSHFILDTHPAHPNVSVACGFSGHGFKFAPVVGEIMADLAVNGRTDLPASFLGLRRFAGS
jgi:sarcosine oxidase